MINVAPRSNVTALNSGWPGVPSDARLVPNGPVSTVWFTRSHLPVAPNDR